MAFVTVAQVLEIPVVRGAGPELLSGSTGLGHEVRWVHTTELADIAPLLRSGDLLLTTGIALPETPDGLRKFAASLDEIDAAGLLIELGRRWSRVPAALVEACEVLRLPLVALTREVRFVAIAQAVGERIVDQQLAELREARRVHETFTELSIAEAGLGEILEAVQRLSGAAVVLESEQHQVLDYRSGPEDICEFLANWTARSRSALLDGRTVWDERNGWLLTRLGRRDRGWGRLVVQAPVRPSERLIAAAERAAAALALHQLHDRHRDSLIRRVHHELLVGLLSDPTDAELQRRVELAGVPMAKRQFVGLTFRPRVEAAEASGRSQSLLEEMISSIVHAAHELKVPTLVSEVDRDVRALLALAPAANPTRVVDDLAARVSRRHRAVIAAGRPVAKVAEVDRTLKEALHVVQSIQTDAHDGMVHRLEDVHLRGLLTLLADDERLRLFVSRELDALKDDDARSGNGLFDAVRALVRHPISKSQASESLHLSRPVFYDRLAKAARVLGADLDDPDIRVSLHVAILADEMTAPGGCDRLDCGGL